METILYWCHDYKEFYTHKIGTITNIMDTCDIIILEYK